MRTVIAKYAGMPFEYGADCCRFAADCVLANTGRDPMANVEYATKGQALRLISTHGGLAGALRHYLGDPYKGCQEGDVCLLDANRGRLAAGVIYQGRVVARVESGLMDYPLDRALMVWPTHA